MLCVPRTMGHKWGPFPSSGWGNFTHSEHSGNPGYPLPLSSSANLLLVSTPCWGPGWVLGHTDEAQPPQNSAGRPIQDTEGPSQEQNGDHGASAGLQAGLETKDERTRVDKRCNNAAVGLPISWLQSRDSEKGGEGWSEVPNLSASKTRGLTEHRNPHTSAGAQLCPPPLAGHFHSEPPFPPGDTRST